MTILLLKIGKFVKKVNNSLFRKKYSNNKSNIDIMDNESIDADNT